MTAMKLLLQQGLNDVCIVTPRTPCTLWTF